MFQRLMRPLAWAILGICSISAWAQGIDAASTKDIIERTLGGQNTGNSAIKLSFLILNKDGSTQMERAAHYPFYSGEMMRVKILSAQSGTLQLTNINATGKVTPMRTIPVQAGTPAYYPPENNAVLEFANAAGSEILRVVFTPQASMSSNGNWNNGNPTAYGQPNPSPSYAPLPGNAMQPSGQVMTGQGSSGAAYIPPTQPVESVGNGNVSGGAQGQGGAYPVQGNYGIPGNPGGVNPVPPASGQQGMASGMPSRPSEYFTGVQGKAYAYAKDIRETVLETPNATYLTRPTETGAIQFEVTIQHRNF